MDEAPLENLASGPVCLEAALVMSSHMATTARTLASTLPTATSVILFSSPLAHVCRAAAG